MTQSKPERNHILAGGEFFLVWCAGAAVDGTVTLFETYGAAKDKALDLASRYPDRTFHVMKSCGYAKTERPVRWFNVWYEGDNNG